MLRALVTLLVVSATLAHAQAPDPKVLVKEGKALLKQKKLDEACAKFDESERLAPEASTELLLADCREKTGKLATAYRLFTKIGTAPAKRRAAKLLPKLSYLTIEVPTERRVFQLEVARDGVPLEFEAWGTKQPIDPGTYTLTARAPGRVSWTTTVTIDKKEQSVEMPALDEVRRPVAPAREERIAKQRGGRRFKAATIGLAVVGAGGVGFGIAMGLRARSLSADSDAICPHEACLDLHALDLNKRARTSATLANVGLVAGGAALLGAGVLWWIGRPTITPVVEREQVGFLVEGTW